MPQLIKLTFDRRPVIYELELGWDDKAYSEGEIAFDIRASRSIEGEPNRQDLAVSVAVNSDRELVVRAEKLGEITIPLAELFAGSQIINRIPSFFFAGDPVVGCLVRAGSVHQLARLSSVRMRLRA